MGHLAAILSSGRKFNATLGKFLGGLSMMSVPSEKIRTLNYMQLLLH